MKPETYRDRPVVGGTEKPNMPELTLEDEFAEQLDGLLAEFSKMYPEWIGPNAYTYERQYKFEPTRKWAFDFAWPSLKIAVEVDGGTWIDGAHNRGQGIQNDSEKRNTARAMGWTVFQVTADDVHEGRALAWVKERIEA